MLRNKLRVKGVRSDRQFAITDALLVQALANAQSATASAASRRSRSEKRPIPVEQKDVRYALQ